MLIISKSRNGKMSREAIYQVLQNRKDGCINHHYRSLEEAYAKGIKYILKAQGG